MVIFDTGGFKPMNGLDEKLRWRNARKAQQILDGAPPSELGERLDEAKFFDAIDDRAFGSPRIPNIFSTPGANTDRSEYLRLNNLDPAAFKTEVDALSQQLGREIPYAPPDG